MASWPANAPDHAHELAWTSQDATLGDDADG